MAPRVFAAHGLRGVKCPVRDTCRMEHVARPDESRLWTGGGMKRVVVLCLLCAALVGEGALAQVAAPAELTDAQVGNLITSISTLMASKLDRKLPVIPLAEWLRTEAGPGARLSWAFDSGGGIPDRVE